VNAGVEEGLNATFSVASSGGPTFQWQVSTNGGTTFTDLTNTAPYSGATTATLTLTAVTIGLNTYRYRAVATNGSGSATSNAATLTVFAAGSQPPTILTAPVDTSTVAGATATFTVSASGSPTYQWQLRINGTYTNLANTAPYSGVTTATLTVTGVTAGLEGNHYRVVATNAAGSAASIPGRLNVASSGQAPAITTQPSNASASVGSNVTFGVAASGIPSPTFQWQISTNGGSTFANLTNSAPYGGTTTATLTVTNVTSGLAGYQYRAVATNGSGSATSSAATLTAPPTFSDDPLTVGTTAVKAVHITELRQAVESLRSRAGLGAVTWTDGSIVAGVTPVRAVHIAELRAALLAVYSSAQLAPPTYTRAVVTESTSVISRVDISELRAAILAIF
jgi:hypothetical protein